MNVLITGAGGQLGQTFRHLAGNGDGKCRYCYAGHDELDITDAQAVARFLDRNRTDIIVNCAAYTQVDLAESEPEAAMLLNAQAAGILAREARRHGATLIHISTDYVFSGVTASGEAPHPYRETDETAPVTVYGRTKLDGETAIMNSGCNYLIIRTAWLYSSFGKNFVKTMQRLFSEKDAIKVVDDQVGTPTNARDLAAFLLDIIAGGKTGKSYGGIYNYTGEGSCTWYGFAKEISRLTGNERCTISPCTTADYPTPACRPAWSVLDKSKVKAVFGISIPDWKDSLEDFIKND